MNPQLKNTATGAATGATIAGISIATLNAVLVGAVLAGAIVYLISSKK